MLLVVLLVVLLITIVLVLVLVLVLAATVVVVVVVVVIVTIIVSVRNSTMSGMSSSLWHRRETLFKGPVQCFKGGASFIGLISNKHEVVEGIHDKTTCVFNSLKVCCFSRAYTHII